MRRVLEAADAPAREEADEADALAEPAVGGDAGGVARLREVEVLMRLDATREIVGRHISPAARHACERSSPASTCARMARGISKAHERPRWCAVPS